MVIVGHIIRGDSFATLAASRESLALRWLPAKLLT
jgi:hypothetical protein